MLQVITGNTFINFPAVLFARVVDAHGNLVTPSSVTAASYTIYSIDPGTFAVLSTVPGHVGVSITPANLLFATLQVTNEWTLAGGDGTGYNLRYELPTGAGQPFPARAPTASTSRSRLRTAAAIGPCASRSRRRKPFCIVHCPLSVFHFFDSARRK